MTASKTKLDDLHADLWLEIFAYFHADGVLHTFLHVSQQLNHLILHNTQLRLHVRIDDDFSAEILSRLEPTRIVSLTLEQTAHNHLDVSRLTSLQSAVIIGSNTDQWMEHLLTQLVSLPKIRHVSISLYYNDRGSHLFQLALRLPLLHQLRFADRSTWHSVDQNLEDFVSTIVPSLEKLELNLYCPFAYMRQTLPRLSNVRTLRLRLLRGDEYSADTFPPLKLNRVTTVHLTICDVSFDRIISLLRTMTNLRRITFDGNVWGTNIIAYFRSEKWLQLLDINQQSKRIVVDLDLRQDYSNLSGDNIGQINYRDFEKLGLQVTTFTIKGTIDCTR